MCLHASSDSVLLALMGKSSLPLSHCKESVFGEYEFWAESTSHLAIEPSLECTVFRKEEKLQLLNFFFVCGINLHKLI